MKNAPHIPLSPAQLPLGNDLDHPEDLDILQTDLLQSAKFLEHAAGTPSARIPKYISGDLIYTATVEWALRPGDSRIEAYFIGSNSNQRHWFLVQRTIDDLSPYEKRYLDNRSVAMVRKGSLSHQEAAILLLTCTWQYERDNWGTPHFFMVSDCNLLGLSTIMEIADMIWPE
jgi:hypothetical protein